MILKLRFSWHPCCLHPCLSAFIIRSSGALLEWLKQSMLSTGDPGSGNCSHWGQASACSVYNTLHKSHDKHSSLLFPYLTSTTLKSRSFHIHVNIYMFTTHVRNPRQHLSLYLSFFLTLVGDIPTCIQKGMEVLLGPLLVVNVFVKTFFCCPLQQWSA